MSHQAAQNRPVIRPPRTPRACLHSYATQKAASQNHRNARYPPPRRRRVREKPPAAVRTGPAPARASAERRVGAAHGAGHRRCRRRLDRRALTVEWASRCPGPGPGPAGARPSRSVHRPCMPGPQAGAGAPAESTGRTSEVRAGGPAVLTAPAARAPYLRGTAPPTHPPGRRLRGGRR